MSSPQPFQFSLKLGGSNIPEDDKKDIIEIVVDTDLNQPGMVTMLFDDPELKWVDHASLVLGAMVEVTVGNTKLLTAEIASLEPTYSGAGNTTLLVKAYDKSHRLHRNTKTRTFLKQKDSDIVKTIAGDAGLSATATATKTTFDYVLQFNETGMQFLRRLADRNGYLVYSDGDKLYFKPPPDLGSTDVTLKLGETLLDFKPRLSGVGTAPDKVEFRGYDVAKKEAIVSEATAFKPTHAIGMGVGATVLKSKFSTNTMNSTPVLFDKSDGDARAAGYGSLLGARFMQADGLCLGNEKMKAGSIIEIKGIGTRFGGNYLATSVRHVLTAGGWDTYFSASGYEPATLRALLAASAPAPAMPGVAPALVTNNNDPQKWGRVKVKFPWMPLNAGADIESDWLRVLSPMAGATRGMLFIPEVNDEVLVAAEFGDWGRAYVIGSVWNGKDAPPLEPSVYAKGGKIVQRVIKTRLGHTILLDDSDDAPKIEIVDKTTKNKIIIDSKTNSMEIACDKDLKITAKGKIDIEATQDVSIKGMNMKMEANSNFNVDAKANLGLKATANLSAEATAQLTLKGTAQASLEGTGGVKVTSPAIAQIQGSLVKIN